MVRYYNSGYYLDGDPIYHTEESCPEARRVRAVEPEERTVQDGMDMCPNLQGHREGATIQRTVLQPIGCNHHSATTYRQGSGQL